MMQPAEISKVLSVDTRVRIIELLKEHGQLGSKELGERLGITTAAASQHLKVLKHAGLVTSERKGFWVPYSLDPEAMECCRQVLNDVCCCDCRTEDVVQIIVREDSLEDLRKYETELKKELKRVQEKVKKLKSGR